MLLVGGKVDFFSLHPPFPADSLAANYTSLQFPPVPLPLFALPGYRLPLQPSFNPTGSLEIPVFINFRPVGARDRPARLLGRVKHFRSVAYQLCAQHFVPEELELQTINTRRRSRPPQISVLNRRIRV